MFYGLHSEVIPSRFLCILGTCGQLGIGNYEDQFKFQEVKLANNQQVRTPLFLAFHIPL